MKIRLLALVVVLALTSFPIARVSETVGKNRQRRYKQTQSLTAEQVASKYLPGVVLVICDDGIGNQVQGSGFFVSRQVVVTNYHLIRGMVRGQVVAKLPGRNRVMLKISSILDYDRREDLALLQVAETLEPAVVAASPEVAELLALSKELKGETPTPKSIAEGTSEDPLGIDAFLFNESLPRLSPLNEIPKVGERIFALGNPLGLEGTISDGIVSGFRQVGASTLLQITTPISAGSSGGPVINTKGMVIGVVAATLEEGQNLNFAIPSQSVRKLIPRFVGEDYRIASSSPGAWKIPRGLSTP